MQSSQALAVQGEIMSKRFYKKPKFGWRPRGITPRPNSRAAKQQRIPRASDRSGLGANNPYTGRGITGKVFARIQRWLGRKQRQRMRPPKLPKEYTVDVK